MALGHRLQSRDGLLHVYHQMDFYMFISLCQQAYINGSACVALCKLRFEQVHCSARITSTEFTESLNNMATNSFGYEMEEVSVNYAKYFLTYPPELYEKILQYSDGGSAGMGRRGLAVDVGCGCGHSTLGLTKHFKTVIGIESSETQLKEAKKVSADYGNVCYKLGSAESLSSLVTTESADLVTAGAALHWFEIVDFYKECLKIMKPGGTVAVYTYNTPTWDNSEANKLLRGLFRETFKNYFHQRANIFFTNYAEPWALLPQFFDQCERDESLSLEVDYNLRGVRGFIESYPQYFYYKRDHPEHPDEVDLLLERLMDIFNTNSTEEKVIKARSPIILLLGRKV